MGRGAAVDRTGWYRALAVTAGALVLSAGLVVVPGTSAAAASATVGADISFPQCGTSYPTAAAFGVVGVNDGVPESVNPCLASEYRWASSTGAAEFYMNTANTAVTIDAAYAGGSAAAAFAYATAGSAVGAAAGRVWWLDVETTNSWTGDRSANTAAIAGAIAFLRSRHEGVGIYSTRYQWAIITGGARIPSVLNWVPGAPSAAEAPLYCSPAQSFTGGPVAVSQFTSRYDYDLLCPGVVSPPLPRAPASTNLFTAIANWLRSL